MRKKRKAFTLVELLVVVAIITILAALLLPTMEKALEASRTSDCLSRKRQLYLGLSDFALENNDRLPHFVTDYTNGNRIPEDYLDTQYNSRVLFYPGSWSPMKITAYSLGVLALQGYIQSPELLYCQGWKRSRPSNVIADARENVDLPQYRSFWHNMLKASLGQEAYCGTSTYWYMLFPSGTVSNNSGSYSRGYLRPFAETFTAIASYQALRAKNVKVSPLLISCANQASNSQYGSSPIFYGFYDEEKFSHQLRGVNSAFFDGSGRWISQEEVFAKQKAQSGYGHIMLNITSNCAMQWWAHAFAQLGR